MEKGVIKAFKYRGEFDRDIKALQNNQLFAPNKELLNDPCEMLTSDRIFLQGLKLIEQFSGASSEKVKSEFESFKKRILRAGVFSLSVSKEPLNILMWSYYANNHKGFCVEYDIGILAKYNSAVNKFRIKYSNKIPVFKPKLLSGMGNEIIKHFTGYKSKDWKYENEYRLLYDNSGFHDYEHRAVKSIFFGSKMEDKEKEIIFKSLQGRCIKYFQMHLHSEKYKLYCEEIIDPYRNVKRKIIINTTEKIKWFLESAKKDSGIELSDYLRKAVNLVSNYPNVKNILEAIVIIDNDNPIMKVEYQIKEYGSKNSLPKVYRFTKEEIIEEYKNVIES